MLSSDVDDIHRLSKERILFRYAEDIILGTALGKEAEATIAKYAQTAGISVEKAKYILCLERIIEGSGVTLPSTGSGGGSSGGATSGDLANYYTKSQTASEIQNALYGITIQWRP